MPLTYYTALNGSIVAHLIESRVGGHQLCPLSQLLALGVLLLQLVQPVEVAGPEDCILHYERHNARLELSHECVVLDDALDLGLVRLQIEVLCTGTGFGYRFSGAINESIFYRYRPTLWGA